MKVYVDLHEAHNLAGEILCVHPRVVIEHSPREGFDHEKLRTLETKLTEVLNNGLNDAIARKEAP
jgi:hypothetical protein